MSENKPSILTIKVLLTISGLVLIGYLWWSDTIVSVFSHFNQEQISLWVNDAGFWGPLLIIGFMTAAVVASPIPSAPIAIVAGAAYGQIYGTVYIIVGAFLGANIAFYIARVVGRNTLRKWFGHGLDKGLLGSQNALTAVIFTSRLIPFVSFDMISYAAGLSIIKPWRFALATLVGVVPMAFLMAHLGEMAVVGTDNFAMWFSLILGLLVSMPVIFYVFRKWRHSTI